MGKIKYFYDRGEKVWNKVDNKIAFVKEVNPEQKNVIITMRNNGEEVEKKVNLWDIRPFKEKDIVYFAKVKEDAKIPTKDRFDAGFDLYCCSDEDIMFAPGDVKLVPTGIASAMSPKYRIKIRERGSTGTKGFAIRSGVVDPSFRGEIFVAMNNTSSKPFEITKGVDEVEDTPEFIRWPMNKAIAQAVVEINPNINTKEITYEELQKIESKRGTGMLDSTGK